MLPTLSTASLLTGANGEALQAAQDFLTRDLPSLTVVAGGVGALAASQSRIAAAAPNLTATPEGKTIGVLRAGGSSLPLTSGRAGPAASLPRGTPGMDLITKTHVEGHAAAAMRLSGTRDATLFISKEPCSSCSRLLERMLPGGGTLRVLGPGGYDNTFTGSQD